MQVENIKKFLQTAYTDEKLAALLAHAQDGKLVFNSCCCLLGCANATHALMTGLGRRHPDNPRHHQQVRTLPFAQDAEDEFCMLGMDEKRREVLIPLIEAEMERRSQKFRGTTIEELISQVVCAEVRATPEEEQLRLEEIEAEREGLITEMSGYPYPENERR